MKVFVTNIPLVAYTSAWVEIPDGVAEGEAEQGAVASAIIAYDFSADFRKPIPHVEVDRDIIEGGWEFTIKERQPK